MYIYDPFPVVILAYTEHNKTFCADGRILRHLARFILLLVCIATLRLYSAELYNGQ